MAQLENVTTSLSLITEVCQFDESIMDADIHVYNPLIMPHYVQFIHIVFVDLSLITTFRKIRGIFGTMVINSAPNFTTRTLGTMRTVFNLTGIRSKFLFLL